MESSSNQLEENLISTINIEETHSEVTATKPSKFNVRVSIALAVPAETSTMSEFNGTLATSQTQRKVSDSNKAQAYYRVEYSLIPDAAPIGLDIVVFRTAAKIYPDNQDSKIILTWEQSNDQVWIAWEQTHSLDLDREKLLVLLSHKIIVKIWDGKEYCMTRTKLDKPRIARALSALQSAKDETKSTRSIVQRIAQNFADKWLPKLSLYSLRRKLPIEIPPAPASLQKKLEEIERSRSVVTSISTEISMKTDDSIIDETKQNSVGNGRTPETNRNSSPDIFKSVLDENQEKPVVKKKRRYGSRIFKINDEKKEKGTAQILFPSKFIFAGFKTISCRIDDNPALPRTIQDFFFSLHIEDHSLLKETLATELNPLTVTISHVENMPSKPISFHELRQRCEPAYCSYQIFDEEIHQTERREHASDIYWNDLNLFLINLMSEKVLSDFRNSPILNIELHDRDEKSDSRKKIGSVFGTEYTDDSIARVTGKMNILKEKNEADWFPHGCVRLDLSELWFGQTALEFDVPVVPCHGNEAPTNRMKNGKRVTSAKPPAIQPGDYLSSGTQMKVTVRLAHPLTRSIENRLNIQENLQTSTSIPPFTRIIFIFPYSNTKFLTALETCIRVINAGALEFDDQPPHRQVAALSTYKLTEAQQNSQTLNIITGFHLFDDENHVFVLEGRKEEGIDVIYQKLPKPQGQNVEILYDSSILFNERIYVRFGVDIIHVKLSKTLREIVSHPLIFVRDTLPKETFEAVDKMHQLVNSSKLSSTTRHNLYPTVEMLGSLTRDFGVPLTEKEIRLFATDDRSPSASTNDQTVDRHTTKETDEQNSEKSPCLSREQIRQENLNFMQKNIEQVHQTSLKNKENREQQDENKVFVTIGPIYPYSCQKLNASENAVEQMRNFLKQNHRSSSCSYNPDYQSRAFSPYSNEESPMDYHHKLRSPIDGNLSKSRESLADKTASDWIHYSGHRTSLQSNAHPKLPDPARLDELSKPPESLFDSSSMKTGGTALSREPLRWIQRKEDFDRWSRPPSVPPNISKHWQNQLDSNRVSPSNSNSPTPTLIAPEDRMHFLRRSTQTELTSSGRLSATQLDRLTGLLKDKPIKKGLLLPKSYARKLKINTINDF